MASPRDRRSSATITIARSAAVGSIKLSGTREEPIVVEAKTKKNWLVPVLALLMLVGCWLLFRSIYPPFTPPTLPSANGYDDFLKAAEMLAARTGFYDEMSPEELKSVVEHNRPALELAREGLQKECMVALNWSGDRAWFDNVHMKNLESLRALARAFAAEGRQADLDGQMDKAVQCGLEIIELANACGQGGLIVDRMVAGGVHYTALFSLHQHVKKLTKVDAMRLLKKLQISPLRPEPPEVILPREKVLFRSINGSLQTIMMTGFIRSQRQQSVETMQTSDKQHAVVESLLQTHLALHAYRIDNGQLPKKLDALVPDYLAGVPRDGFSGNPILYRPKEKGYLLYSVGPDGVDDEGVEMTDGQSGDLLLEVDDY